MITAGIDAGAATIKAVLLVDGRVAGSIVRPTGFDFSAAAAQIYDDLLRETGTDRAAVGAIGATGYGRDNVAFATKKISEITAHARGVAHLYPEVRGIIDIGGQDSKIIVVNAGKVVDFLMNDRCAAGTGKFLEHTARALELSVEDLGQVALSSTGPASINSMCTVFAESEVISLRARGYPKKDIAAGLVESISRRVAVMAKQKGLDGHIALVGGVAKNSGIRAALEKELGMELFVPPEPQITGAMGAALLAAK
ncbi:acyl-CoA dehydratase activase [Methanocella arvoryzae]|uniref:2-hydroxyglutaryl-CoA dehydratase activator,component C (Archerase) n=1 Tax=Methanocella arvoryzae (strain DSM 22066 / NBRC 105507 / MRE50) TaxID=351160 RepID=Q0W378_METAR|nr:acyl-CoA dehydratase activase [Methanocella arvoryzae]CAJ37165.1 2-hydroxyglutaryl-CoA dehydratase activator,component C (archerase) [Methanocella arvoryzae MRE50]